MLNLVRPSELETARRWLNEAFLDPAGSLARLPLSLHYDNALPAGSAPSPFAGWTVRREQARVEQGVTYETVRLADPRTGLECRVHQARGALTQTNDFAPLETPLTLRQGGSTLQLGAGTGKSSTVHMPFFNLELGNGGILGAIGWTGGLAARFERQVEGVRARAGMERTHLRLHPGEEIRTSRILLLFWEEDRTRSQNLLRRLILAHYAPRPNGRLLQPPFCEGVWGAATEASHHQEIAWLKENGIPAECYWINAGWYGDRPVAELADASTNGWSREVGTWTSNPAPHPRGLAPVGEAVRAAGLGFLLWSEPERAFQGAELARQHPDWLIGPAPAPAANGDNYLVNLGLPEARRAVTDLVSDLIRSAGITCDRQDFNFLTVPVLFAGADAADRVGLAEIRHIEGLYALWDQLLARHPGLVIDNCVDGGQRIDLETIARSLPLWRSDLQCSPFDPVAMQTQTQSLASWVPLSAGVCEATPYAMGGAFGQALVTHWSMQAVEGAPLGRPIRSGS